MPDDDQLEARREARVRNSRIGQGFLKQVAARLAAINVDELSPTDVARWMEVAMKLAQQGTLREGSPARRREYLASINCNCDDELAIDPCPVHGEDDVGEDDDGEEVA